MDPINFKIQFTSSNGFTDTHKIGLIFEIPQVVILEYLLCTQRYGKLHRETIMETDLKA